MEDPNNRIMRFSDLLREGMTELDASTSGSGWGVVTDNDDPKGQGRLRLRLPWHRLDQSSDWVPRLGGGGNNYGETGSVPQEGELVSLSYPRGNLHQPYWTRGVWTEGGKGPNGHVPVNLPPHLQKDAAILSNPTHKPEKGRFKIWFWRSLAGFFLHVGEGLDWLHFRSPKGFDLKLEHDVPVNGKDKTAAQSNLPYHHLLLTTPTGHTLESTEWAANDQNELRMTHTAQMGVQLLEKPTSGSREVNVTLGTMSLRLKIAPGIQTVSLSDGAGEMFTLDALAHKAWLTAGTEVNVTAPTVNVVSPNVNLGGAGGRPVARVGDMVQGADPQGGIVTSFIMEGSLVTKST